MYLDEVQETKRDSFSGSFSNAKRKKHQEYVHCIEKTT